jgi:hypothetical protein
MGNSQYYVPFGKEGRGNGRAGPRLLNGRCSRAGSLLRIDTRCLRLGGGGNV